MARKHRRGKKPTITGRIANQQPEPQPLPWKPSVPVVVDVNKLIEGFDFGATEARVVAHYQQQVGRAIRPAYREVYTGRLVGKTEAVRTWAAAFGPETPIEPLGAGLSRILSRGLAQPVRYPYPKTEFPNRA